MAFLAPLVEMAGAAAAPTIESLVGAEAAKTVTPLAQKALSSLSKSKMAHSAIHKIGNHLFNTKNKTARNLLDKGSKVANLATSKQAHKLLGEGLKIGKDVGILDESQAKKILDTHGKAMALHDQLSSFNKKDHVLDTKGSLNNLIKDNQAQSNDMIKDIPEMMKSKVMDDLKKDKKDTQEMLKSVDPKSLDKFLRLERYDRSRDKLLE